jgi:anti-sigma factor (TIGR02949 family)
MKISESCRETFQRLDDYLDRELTADEAQEVAKHLDHCAKCAEEFAVEADLLAMLKEKLRHIAAPPGLMDRIRQRLEAEG